MCPASRSEQPEGGLALPQLVILRTCLLESRTARPFHSIRNLETPVPHRTFAVTLLHDPSSSAPFGGSDHGEELFSRTLTEDSLVRNSAETRWAEMFGFGIIKHAKVIKRSPAA